MSLIVCFDRGIDYDYIVRLFMIKVGEVLVCLEFSFRSSIRRIKA